MDNLTNTDLLGISEILGVSIAVILIGAIIYCVIAIVAGWKVFTKAGEPGWKAIIPVYNEYTQYKFSWNTTRFWQMFCLSIVIGMIEMINGAADSESVKYVVSSIGILVVGIPLIILSIKSKINLAKAFGKSAGFAVGLFLLNPIFMLILAFDSSKYIGNKSEN